MRWEGRQAREAHWVALLILAAIPRLHSSSAAKGWWRTRGGRERAKAGEEKDELGIGKYGVFATVTAEFASSSPSDRFPYRIFEFGTARTADCEM